MRCLKLVVVLCLVGLFAADANAGWLRGRFRYRHVERGRGAVVPTVVVPTAPRPCPPASTATPPAKAPTVVPPVIVPPVVIPPRPVSFGEAGAVEALDEVNAKRAASGLRPFIRDHGLTQAASACASFRARMRLFGHTGNDFSFCPPGCSAVSAGCAAYPPGFGWMSCDVYDNYTFAGAAWAMGDDGRRYMHLFVR